MNTEPIENACDADLRCSKAALQRAAQRARELAAQTGTCIVIGHDGVVEQIVPAAGQTSDASNVAQEPMPPDGDKA